MKLKKKITDQYEHAFLYQIIFDGHNQHSSELSANIFSGSSVEYSMAWQGLVVVVTVKVSAIDEGFAVVCAVVVCTVVIHADIAVVACVVVITVAVGADAQTIFLGIAVVQTSISGTALIGIFLVLIFVSCSIDIGSIEEPVAGVAAVERA